MQIDTSGDRPIFLQIADQIEDAVFTGVFPEGQQVPSTTEISAQWQINPHTVLKGMNLLVEQEILFKKRGLGMFVKEGACARIRAKRQQGFFDRYVASLVAEAKKLDLTREQVVALIERGYTDDRDTDTGAD